MKRVVSKSKIVFGVVTLVEIVISIIAVLTGLHYKKQYQELKLDYENAVASEKDTFETLIERNQELYNCKMEKEEWKELFYSAIDFHPNEGPDW